MHVSCLRIRVGLTLIILLAQMLDQTLSVTYAWITDKLDKPESITRIYIFPEHALKSKA